MLQGLTEGIAERMLSSIATSTLDQYKKHLKDWSMFCESKDLDPYSAQEASIIEFLDEIFSKGLAYGSLNTARSAISLISADSKSEKSLVQRFMKAVYRSRPPKPKYDKIWDIDPVLEKLATWPPIESLSLQLLTNKLLFLLALGTSHRIQTFSLIKISNIRKYDTGFEIKVPDLIKTSRPGNAQPLFSLKFSSQKELCIASLLEAYLNRTVPLRGQLDSLFITVRKPHRAASTETISRWMRSVMSTCGISEEYTAYSTRHASSTAALKKGINLDIIKKVSGWSERSMTFFKFYNRPVELQNNYAANVLQS